MTNSRADRKYERIFSGVTVAFLLYSLQTRQFTCSTNLIPAFVLQPAGVWVNSGVLQTHSSSQQEHEVSVFNLLFCSEKEKRT